MKTKVVTLKNLDSQGLFLYYLFLHFGGLYNVGSVLKVGKYQPQNWVRQGGVPLRHITMVSKVLRVPPELLNFRAYSKFGSESFKNLLKNYSLSSEQQKEILKRGV